MSTSVALVITAEYDRQRTLMGSVPPAINLFDWKEKLFTQLYEIGFFDNIGHQTDIEAALIDSQTMRTMRIQSGTNATEIEAVSGQIYALSEFLNSGQDILKENELDLNNALSEAMINVAQWAYPPDHQFVRTHVGKWWVTASADRTARKLKVVFYDQGASIPVTFPKQRLAEAVGKFLSNILVETSQFAYEDDGAYIRSAMQIGKSRSNQKHRGRGLPEMKDLVDAVGSGSVAVFSRGGWCRYASGTGFTHGSRPHSVGGTLIEWVLDV